MRKIREIELAGRACTIKLNNMALATVEKQLGKSIVAVMQEGFGIEALHTLLWQGMKAYEPKLKLRDVYDLVDEAIDQEPEKYQEIMEALISLVMECLGLGEEEEKKSME